MNSRYRISKKTDGPTGRVTFTPEYYGYKHLWPFKRWWDFSWDFNGIYGPVHHVIAFPTYEEAAQWFRQRDEDARKAMIPDTTETLPIDLSAKPVPLTHDEMESLCVFDTRAECDAAARYAAYAESKGIIMPTPICRESAAWTKP